MRIALINTSKKSKFYPLGLMKISSMLKAQGHTTKLFTNKVPKRKNQFDEIWVSTLFTFEVYHSLSIIREAVKKAKVVKVGGVASSLLPNYFKNEGVEIHIGLLEEAEKYSPDYSLLDEDPEYSIIHTTRGCIRKCKFCVVPKIEPDFQIRDWIQDYVPGTEKIYFYDNNWLAKKKADLKKDCDKIIHLMKTESLKKIDFNQAIDCRLLTEAKADIIKDIPFEPVRFAYDGLHEDGYIQKAIKLMSDRGHRDFNVLMLYNFTDTPEDFYYRIRGLQELRDEISCSHICMVPMRFHPIMDIETKRNFYGEHWNKKIVAGLRAIIGGHSILGQISCKGRGETMNPMQEFEYWFGKNVKEFIQLINYPKIRDLCAKKKNNLMITRYKDKQRGMK